MQDRYGERHRLRNSSNELPSSDNLDIVLYNDEADSERLVELETRIEQNRTSMQQDYASMCLSLLEIRDKGLYLLTHRTFELYLKERWGYSRSHGYRLINHATELQMSPVGDMPESERETRRKRAERKKSQEKPEPEISEARDPALTADAVAALTAMGIPKRQAKTWVDAAKGDVVEELITNALRLRENARNPENAPDVPTISEPPVEQKDNPFVVQQPDSVSKGNAIGTSKVTSVVVQLFSDFSRFLLQLSAHAPLASRKILDTLLQDIKRQAAERNGPVKFHSQAVFDVDSVMLISD